jgi:hypothetical protein
MIAGGASRSTRAEEETVRATRLAGLVANQTTGRPRAGGLLGIAVALSAAALVAVLPATAADAGGKRSAVDGEGLWQAQTAAVATLSPSTKWTTLRSARLPSGDWVVLGRANVTLRSTHDPAGMVVTPILRCNLDSPNASGRSDDAELQTAAGGRGATTTLTLATSINLVAVLVSPREMTASLRCNVAGDGGNVTVRKVTLLAIPLASSREIP